MRSTNIYKIRSSQGYIFRILQLFATKRCSFPNFKTPLTRDRTYVSRHLVRSLYGHIYSYHFFYGRF